MSDDEDELESTRAPLIEHLIELRRRLIYSVAGFLVVFGICLYFSAEIYDFLVRPLSQVLKDQPGRRLIYTGLTEAMLTQIKVAFFASIMFSSPIVAIQIWAFVAPGLYRSERRAFLPFLIATPVLFVAGAAMAYYVVFPVAWKFFLSFQTLGVGTGGLPIVFEGKVNEYLDIVMKLIFAFGVMFLMPVALTLLGYVGLISSDWLKAQRRYAIVLIFFAAAVLTPPDVFSQCSLAIPVCVLYEASIFFVKLAEKRRGKAGAQ